MQSIESKYLRRIFHGKPIHLNWINCTKAEARAVRKLWSEGLIQAVRLDRETSTIIYEGAK